MLEETKLYIETAVYSSRRSRSVFISLQVVVVLVFLVLWNVKVDWLLHRINLTRAAVHYLEEREGSVPANEKLHPSTPDGIPPEHVKEFVEKRGFVRPADAQKILDSFEDFRVSQFHSVALPLFGVTIDVNHVGVLGGVSLLTLLIWLRFSLARNKADIELALARSKGTGDSRLVYDILAARQMLSIPTPASGTGGRRERRRDFWRSFPRLSLATPFVIQTFILVVDLTTMPAGMMVSRDRTIMSVVVSALLFGAIGFVCKECHTILGELDEIWDKDYDSSLPLSPPGGTAPSPVAGNGP